MIDYIASILIRILNFIFNFIPISAGLWLGRRIGGVVFFFNKKRRLIAYANLKAAFGREKPPHELRIIAKRVYQNIAQTFIEVLNLTKVNAKYVSAYVDVINIERVRQAAQSGRGVILLTGHFGNWELSNLVGAIIGFPMVVLAREQKMKRLNELLNRLRELKGCRVIRKGISTKHILKALHDKNIVGILADQDAGKNGVFLDFFGRPASISPGFMEIAQRTDAIVLPNFIVRIKGPHHHVYLEEDIDLGKSPDGNVKECLQKYVSCLESYIRKYPDQWLWVHKRWKSTPIKTVLVLNDGRQGHLNQSLAIARQIQRARQTQGYRPDDTTTIIADVVYRSPLHRSLLTAASIASSWRCHGCMRCVRFCLSPDSYQKLMGIYCDFVVSCGSALAPMNVFMARENNAKNIVIMSPGIVGIGRFNLAVIPQHDRPPVRRTVVSTVMAPNLITREGLDLQGERLRSALGLRDGVPRIGLLIGGGNDRLRMSEPLMSRVLEGVTSAAEKLNGEILATTSRRTGQDIEALMKKRLSEKASCALLIIANEKNQEGAVEGILGLSDAVIVSGESISMISEAVSSGKPVIVFELEKKDQRKTKFDAALHHLGQERFIRIARPEEISDAVFDALHTKDLPQQVQDTEKVFEAVRRLI